MKFDLHTHHDRCGHAIGTLKDYVEGAIENGLQVIGLSDHSPFFGEKDDQPFPNTAMARSDFKRYVEEVLELKQQYKDRIEVLLGVESDFFPEYADVYREVYRQYPFDYIIGSVHKSNEISIFDRHRWEGLDETGIVKEKEIYFDLVQQSARSGMFDVLGHIDAMKSNYPDFHKYETPALEETLRTIAESDVVIEVNTSGRIKKCREWHPTIGVLERAHYYGVKVTFGSDSHKADRVGDEWELVRDTLKQIGYREWAIFRQRERILIPL